MSFDSERFVWKLKRRLNNRLSSFSDSQAEKFGNLSIVGMGRLLWNQHMQKTTANSICIYTATLLATALTPFVSTAQEWHADTDQYSVQQLTFGPGNHFFGYIGHAGTVPWNRSGRYILALQTTFNDHMPEIHEPADILLLDTQNQYAPKKIAETRGWNPQQGAMMYWNPAAPETEFFFNDRDPDDGTVFTALFDISRGKNGTRLKEYRFPESPIANSGVARSGSHFLAVNYGRLARCRLVTGYAGLNDWSSAETAPENDGIFKVDVNSGMRNLLVSYRQLQSVICQEMVGAEQYHLFINHTLWNQSDSRIYFYARANFKSRLPKIDAPFTIDADGSNLTRHPYFGGHPEWDNNNIMIGAKDNRQIRYDTSTKKIVGLVGKPGTFPNPGGDIAFDSSGHWFVNGHKRKDLKQTFFTILNRKSNRIIRTEGFPIGDVVSGTLRVDPAPRWNRESNQILIGAYDTQSRTRQLFLLTLKI